MIVALLVGGAILIVVALLMQNRGKGNSSVEQLPPQRAASLFQQQDMFDPTLSTQMPPAPQPPSAKMIYFVAGVVCFLGAAGFFAAVVQFGLVAFAVSVGLFYAGWVLCKAGYRADEQHAKDMQSRAHVIKAQADAERHRIEAENARREAQRRAVLQTERDRADREAIEAERLSHIQRQRDITYQERLRPIAEEYGINISDVIAINVERVRNQLELEKHAGQNKLDNRKRWEQIQQNLTAANLVSLASSEQVKQLTTNLIAAVNLLVSVESNSWPEEQKATVRAQIKKNIKYIQEAIDGLRANARRVQGNNRQKAGGMHRPRPNARAHYPPGVGDNED